MYNIRRWATKRKTAAFILQHRHSCQMHKVWERGTVTDTHRMGSGGHTFMGIITEESHTAISEGNIMQQVSNLDDTGYVILNVEIHIKIKLHGHKMNGTMKRHFGTYTATDTQKNCVFSLDQAMKAQRRRRRIALVFL